MARFLRHAQNILPSGMARKQFDAALVRKAQRGDRRAREVLLRRLEGVLRTFFVKRVGRTANTDDLVQNTLLRVHGGLEALKDPERLKAFAMKAAIFELQDLYRGRYSAKEVLYDPDAMPAVSSDHGIAADSRMDLERALSILTPHARRILELREYGYRYKEIAKILDTTEMAVKMQVKRAFDKMRRAFAQQPGWTPKVRRPA